MLPVYKHAANAYRAEKTQQKACTRHKELPGSSAALSPAFHSTPSFLPKMVEASISKCEDKASASPEQKPKQKAATGFQMKGPSTAPTMEVQQQKAGDGNHLHSVSCAAVSATWQCAPPL